MIKIAQKKLIELIEADTSYFIEYIMSFEGKVVRKKEMCTCVSLPKKSHDYYHSISNCIFF